MVVLVLVGILAMCGERQGVEVLLCEHHAVGSLRHTDHQGKVSEESAVRQKEDERGKRLLFGMPGARVAIVALRKCHSLSRIDRPLGSMGRRLGPVE